jgi:hypothetical protein
MARITRVTAIPFGMSGTTDDFETFGSTAVAATDYSKDIAAIQATSAWLNGWRPALVAAKAPVLQDRNAKGLVDSNLLCYLFQEGIPEYDAGTTYYKGGVVKNLANSGYIEFYASLVDTNLANALPTRVSNGNWLFLYAISTTAQGLIIPGTITNDSAAAGDVGEVITANLAAGFALSLSTGSGKSLCSISLTPGQWDITGLLQFVAASTTSITSFVSSISKTNNTVGGATAVPTAAGEVQVENDRPLVASGSTEIALNIPSIVAKVASTTTYYLVAQAVFSVSTMTAFGSITAVRRR